MCNFADDNTITVSASSIYELNELVKINSTKCIEWFNHNHMTANKSKFQSLVVSKQHSNIEEFVVKNEFKFRVSDTVTLLGVQIDNRLKFGSRIQKICTKASLHLTCLNRLARYMGSNEKFILINSLILCHFNYCRLFGCFATRTVSRNWKILTKEHYGWHCQIIPHLIVNYYSPYSFN